MYFVTTIHEEKSHSCPSPILFILSSSSVSFFLFLLPLLVFLCFAWQKLITKSSSFWLANAHTHLREGYSVSVTVLCWVDVGDVMMSSYCGDSPLPQQRLLDNKMKHTSAYTLTCIHTQVWRGGKEKKGMSKCSQLQDPHMHRFRHKSSWVHSHINTSCPLQSLYLQV